MRQNNGKARKLFFIVGWLQVLREPAILVSWVRLAAIRMSPISSSSFGSFEPISGPAFLIGDQMPAHAPLGIFLVAKFDIAGVFWRDLGDIAAVMRVPGFAVGDNHRFPSSWHLLYKCFLKLSGLRADAGR
jgi:hypothetical protein